MQKLGMGNFIVSIILIVIAFSINKILGLVIAVGYVVFFIATGIGNIYSLIGNYKYSRGQVKEALKWFDKACSSKRCSANARIAYAYLLLKSGDTIKSYDLLKLVIDSKHTPLEDSMAKSNLALVQWKRGDLKGAIETLEGVFENYKNTTIYGSLGYFLVLNGDMDRALKFNLEAYDYNDSDKVILDNLGQTYYFKGEYQASEEIYKKLLKMAPTFPEPYYYYGKVLQCLGKPDEALDTMVRALSCKFTSLINLKRNEVEKGIRELEKITGRKLLE